MRKLSLWLLGCALAGALLPSPAAANGVSVTGFGGTIIPTGNFGDKNRLGAKVGYQLGGSLNYALTPSFEIGVDGSYGKDKGSLEGETIDFGGGDFEKVNTAEFTTVQAGVHGKYLIPVAAPFRPYVLLGLGLYRTRYKEEGDTTFSAVTGPYTIDVATGKSFGGKLGLGGSWSLQEMWALTAEASYNLFSPNTNKGFYPSSLQYLAIDAGLTWKMPMMSKRK